MSKIPRLYLLMILTILNAQEIEPEIAINIGVNSTKNEDGNKFKNQTIGVSYQDNKYIVAPRVDFDYTKVKDDAASSLMKASLNGVYEYDNTTYLTPYALAGFGYEYVNGSTTDVFESHPFVQGGAGIKVGLNRGLELGVEAKALQIIGGNNEENEFILTAGLSMPLNYFSRATVKHKSYSKPQMIRPIEPILVEEPTFVQKPIQVINRNVNECSIKISAPDFDRDGVADSIDQCPATPCSFTVDQYGCPIKTTLKINFETNSADIRAESMFRISKFANFLLSSKGSRVKIVGHTDSRGTTTSNLSLSMRRAQSVVNALVNRGVSPSRLEAYGLGESMPVASNETDSGRALNRRIEAELFYPKGRR